MKHSTAVLQPAPANAQRLSKVKSARGPTMSSNRHMSLERTASIPTIVNLTATATATASPLIPSRRRGGSEGSRNGSHSPKRSDFTSFVDPRKLTTPLLQPQQQQSLHDAAPSPLPIPSASGAPSRETQSRRRTQHIPVLPRSMPSRSATATVITAASPSNSPLYATAQDPRQVQRFAVKGIFPARNLTRRPASSAAPLSRASPLKRSFTGKESTLEAANGVAQPNSFAAPSESTALPSAAACDVAKKRTVGKVCAKTAPRHGSSAPPTLIPTKASQHSLLQRREVSAADKESTAEATDAMLRGQELSACSSARSPLLQHELSEATQPLAFGAASRRSSVWSSEHTNRSVALGASDATLAPSVTSRRPTWMDSVNGEDIAVTEEGGMPLCAAGSLTSLPTSSFSAALGAAAPVNAALPTTGTATTTVTAPEHTATKYAKKRIETKSMCAGSATVANGGGTSNGQGRCPSVTAAIGAKAERRSLTPRSTSQVKKSCDATRISTRLTSSPAPNSPPQTPPRPTTVAAGASPRNPTISSCSGKRPRSSPTLVAASPSGDADVRRGGLLPSGSAATGAPAISAAAAPVVPSAPFSTSETHSHRAAAILSQTLSVMRPMAPVVHVRIRPVLPSIGESGNNRRVYFLDHENVMVTRSRPGASTTNASSAMSPSSLAEVTATRRSATHGQVVPALQLSNLNSQTLTFLSGVRGAAAARNGAAIAADGGSGDQVAVLSTDARCTAAITADSASIKAAPPACSCGADYSLLRSPVAADSSIASKVSTAAAGAAVTRGADGGILHGASSNFRPASERLMPLSLCPPTSMAVHHNRTISWTSQGSEEHSPSSRLSCGSLPTSVSPQQVGFCLASGGAEGPMTFSAFTSAPRTHPWLTTFKPFTEDETPSLSTTPREAKGGSISSGVCATSASSCGAAGGKRRAPEPQRRVRGTGLERKSRYHGVSLSTASLITQPTTRRSSAATAPVDVSPRTAATTSAPSPTSARRRASRSILGASVSVSAMSISTIPKASGGDTNGPKLAEEDAGTELKDTQQYDRQLPRQQAHLSSNSASVSGAATGAEKHYIFEFVHDEEATQTDVFEESVLRFADEALLAQNVAIICYGPTGSGKTYSMMGNQLQSPSAALASSGSAPLPASSEKRHRNRGVSASDTHSPPQPDSRGHTPHDRVSTGEAQRRIIDEAAAVSTGRGAERDAHAIEDDARSDDTDCARLAASWQYGYAGRTLKGTGGSAAGAVRRSHQRYPHSGAGVGPVLTSSMMKLDSTAAIENMTEMGILPRLVHTLLERRGETITIRRDSEREVAGRRASDLQSTLRPTATPKNSGSLSLTLRDLTFYGIELYMDDLCDLLDPGKRPIQAFSDTGGLEALCQRINEARDYRTRNSHGGVGNSATRTARTGGGIPITSLADLRRAYRLAHGNRVTARHAKNDMSSRSHAIFLLQLDFNLIESTDTPHHGAGGEAAAAAPPLPSGHAQRVHSYVAMVDLAGCERVKQTKVEGAALREAQYINKSLSALSSVVLSLHHHNAHVPYRDSKLTRLLRPCLESGRVLTLVHVAPCSSAEAVKTLKFADQIRHIHIPTHALTPTSSKHRELLDVFADLVDPMQGQWEALVRQTQLQVNRLCADVRLFYFSRAVGVVSRRAASGDSLTSDVVSELSVVSEGDDSISASSLDVSEGEGPQILTEDATETDKRRFALRTLLRRLMKPIQSHQRTTMREAVRAIRRHEEHRVLAHRRQQQQRIDELQAALQELTTLNAKLAKENSTPLPRDPQALELSRRIRESTEELGEYAKEQASLISLISALRQRLAAQDDLEAVVDDQLHKVQQRTEQAMRTLSAAVAAHPPGDPPAGSGAAVSKEPTLPTESPTATALVMNTKDDPELRDIAHQQLSLAKELAALRLETACFEIGAGLWEGLWARAMRREIITAMEVEIFAMERILLDRHALSLMMIPGNADVDGEGVRVDDGEADLSSLPLPLQITTYPERCPDPFERDEGGACATTVEHRVAAPLMHSSPEEPLPSVQQLSLSWAPSSTLRARLGSRVHGGASPVDGSSEYTTPQRSSKKEKGGAAVPPGLLVPLRTRRDRAVDLNATAASDKSLSSAAEPFSATSLSSESLRLRTAPACGGGAAPSISRRRGLEVSMPNPLLVLTTNEPKKQLQHHLGSASSPKLSRNNNTSVSVLGALMPLSLAGSFEDEQSMQEACLQLLLREGVPCEVCCLGESASHTLQHYILPSSADAPLAEESEHEEPTTCFSVAPARYHVKAAAAATATSGATEGSDASPATRARLRSVRPCERSGGPKVALCTARHGRLRLTRMPRRPNCYVLEFVYTHQALPMPPRLQAALQEKSEDTFLSTAGKTHLEQMVDALPSVQGVAGRGGGGGSSGSTAVRRQGRLREHRLFAIPLFEPTLHLHVHVLEEGIPNMTTPVTATVGLPSGGTAPAIAGSTFEDSIDHSGAAVSASPASPPAFCIARRPESGPQLVVEVHGVPQTTSACRPVLSADSKKTPKFSQQQQQKPHSPHKTARAGSTAGLNLHSEKPQRAIGHNPSRPSPLSQSAAAVPVPPAPTGAETAVWSDLVLAKRLSSGGELMLPSSCILANTGCCSLVLRFPAPFSASSLSRVESVEAVIGALCGILRPFLTAPEVRASFSSSPSKRTSSARCRFSSSSRSISTGGAEKSGNNSSSQPRCSLSPSPSRCARVPPEVEVINYVHVPHTMFLASAHDTQTTPERAASLGDGAEPLGYAPHILGRSRGSPDTAAAPHSIFSPTACSDSLDGLGSLGGGVLGDTLQSSCSPAHVHHCAAVQPPDTFLPQYTASLNSVKPLRGYTPPVTPAALLMDQQRGATLQVQFYWIPTPLDIEPPGLDAGRKNSVGKGHGITNNGSGNDGAAKRHEVSARRRTIGNSRFPRLSPLTTTAAAVESAKTGVDRLVRLQVLAALSVLAQLSCVFVDGRPLGDAASDGEGVAASSSGSTLTGSLGAHDTRRPSVGEQSARTRSRSETDAARFCDAVAVGSLLRQLDTYRHRIRRLLRQQLYDAKDINGDAVVPPAPQSWLAGELGRGAYLREVQEEVKRTIGLPVSTLLGSVGSGATPSLMSPDRHPRNDGRSTHAALLEPESGNAAPNAHVTVAEARQACATRVPWTVWQWAYRWSRLRRLLRGPSVSCVGGDNAHNTGQPSISQAGAAAAWLPLAACNNHSAASPIEASYPLLASCSTNASPSFATTSSSSDEGFVMESDWLTEAKLAVHTLVHKRSDCTVRTRRTPVLVLLVPSRKPLAQLSSRAPHVRRSGVMLTSGVDGQPVVTVRKFRLGGGQDTDSSDSDDEEGRTSSRRRGGASAASTARTRLVAASQQTSSLTPAAAISASLPPQAGSSSSLEVSTPSSSMSSSPARSALTSGLEKSITATAAPEDVPEEKQRSSSSSGESSNTHQTNHEMGKRERGGGGTAHSRQHLQITDWTVSALLTSTIMCSAKEEKTQLPPGGVITDAAAAEVLPVDSTPSPTTFNSPALLADAVRPRSASTTAFFQRKGPSWTTAFAVAAPTTSSTSLSAGAAAGMSRSVASITTTATMSRLAVPLACTPAQAAATSVKPAPADAVLTVAAAATPVLKSGLSEANGKSVRSSVGAVAAPPGVLEAPPAEWSSSSSSDDAGAAILTPVQIASLTGTGDPPGSEVTATQGLPTRKLTVPWTTAAEVDASPPSSSLRLPLPSPTRPSTAAAAAAAGQTVTPAAVSNAALLTFTAGPGGVSIVSGSGSPMLSGPGSLTYSRVSAQGRGSVPSSVLEAPSRPSWRALPREHTAPPSFHVMTAQSAATSAATPPPPEPVASTGVAHAEVPSLATAHANPLLTSSLSVSLPTRPRRQAPRMPGATHTSAALSLIEDDETLRQCSSSPVESTLSTERSGAETEQSKTVSVHQQGPPSSSFASPPSQAPRAFFSSPARGASSSADGVSLPLLARSAAATAAQREREAALVIYDDRVPPAKRRAKRQALPLTGQAAEGSRAEALSAWLLLPGRRTTALHEGESESVLRCRPVLHFGGGAASLSSHVECFSEKHSLGGRDTGDDDETVDAEDDATRGRLAYTADLHGFSDTIIEQDRYPERSSSGDRPAKAKRYFTCNRIVQRFFSDTQQQQRKLGLNALISRTSSSEPTPRVAMCVVRQAVSTARDVKVAHKDVSIGDLSSAKPPPTTASRIAVASLLTDEALNFDLLNYRRFCSKH